MSKPWYVFAFEVVGWKYHHRLMLRALFHWRRLGFILCHKKKKKKKMRKIFPLSVGEFLFGSKYTLLVMCKNICKHKSAIEMPPILLYFYGTFNPSDQN